MKVPMAPERKIVRQCWKTSSDAREDRVDLRRYRLDGGAAHGLQHLGDTESAHQRRQQSDTARKVRAAEGEALVVVVWLLADGGDP